MTLKLYNSLTREKQEFVPLDKKNVRMYVCGPTVYDRPHLGNARSVVVYDVLFRLLRHLHGEEHVTYVRNITDVDDKINAAATQRGISIQELTKEVTAQFHEDMDALNCLRPTIEPTATGHIAEIIAMIEQLIANGNAYAAEGHVLFDVTSSPLEVDDGKGESLTRNAQGISTSPASGRDEKWHYGMLSGRKAEEQEAGARIAVESYKKNPGDFVLWKPAKESDDASSKFDSPWGVGRPGWHIECSAMSTKHLGATFDIHGGGADLMFPHHENEIAQSRCAAPESEFARYWVHNGFLTVNGEKMSKSLGNFTTVKDVLDKGVHGEVIRFALLSSHYRKPLDWNEQIVKEYEDNLYYICEILYEKANLKDFEWPADEEKVTEILKPFFRALADDLNIALARALLFDLLEKTKTTLLVKQPDYTFIAALQRATKFLGIASYDFYQTIIKEEPLTSPKQVEEIEAQIAARAEAKKAKNWAEADRIRDALKAQGILLEDRPDGTTDWRRA